MVEVELQLDLSEVSSNTLKKGGGLSKNTSLEVAFSQASMLSANNVNVSPLTLCLHDERNARKNCEVNSWRLVCEQPLTSIFPCVDSIHFILSALKARLPKLQHPNTEGCAATVHSHVYSRGVCRLGGKIIIGGIERAQDEMD